MVFQSHAIYFLDCDSFSQIAAERDESFLKAISTILDDDFRFQYDLDITAMGAYYLYHVNNNTIKVGSSDFFSKIPNSDWYFENYEDVALLIKDVQGDTNSVMYRISGYKNLTYDCDHFQVECPSLFSKIPS